MKEEKGRETYQRKKRKKEEMERFPSLGRLEEFLEAIGGARGELEMVKEGWRTEGSEGGKVGEENGGWVFIKD